MVFGFLATLGKIGCWINKLPVAGDLPFISFFFFLAKLSWCYVLLEQTATMELPSAPDRGRSSQAAVSCQEIE